MTENIEKLHACEVGVPSRCYTLDDDCHEDLVGRLFFRNGEYSYSQVNYCPYCGYKAKVTVPKEYIKID